MENNHLGALKVVPRLEDRPVCIMVPICGKVALGAKVGRVGGAFLKHVEGQLRHELKIVGGRGKIKERSEDLSNIQSSFIMF